MRLNLNIVRFDIQCIFQNLANVAKCFHTKLITTHPIARMEQDNVLFEEFEKLYGGMWDLEVDPIKHAHKMIAHIDKKRQALGIDKARDRILVDMAARRELETA